MNEKNQMDWFYSNELKLWVYRHKWLGKEENDLNDPYVVGFIRYSPLTERQHGYIRVSIVPTVFAEVKEALPLDDVLGCMEVVERALTNLPFVVE